MTIVDGIVIAFLPLLAIDALIERISLLEKIDEKVDRWPEIELLADRSKLVRMKELAENAMEICASGSSLISIKPSYGAFDIQGLREGCNLRFCCWRPTPMLSWFGMKGSSHPRPDMR
jgi:hypothetical protein